MFHGRDTWRKPGNMRVMRVSEFREWLTGKSYRKYVFNSDSNPDPEPDEHVSCFFSFDYLKIGSDLWRIMLRRTDGSFFCIRRVRGVYLMRDDVHGAVFDIVCENLHNDSCRFFRVHAEA